MGRWRRPREPRVDGGTADIIADAVTCDGTTVIDLDGGSRANGISDGHAVLLEAELRRQLRERAEREEAQRDLLRLRARHWSAERVLEEGRRELEWWEHPEADPYAVLGLLPGASLHEASAARRRIANLCHPDRGTPGDMDSDEAIRRMVAANAAYDRLRRALHPL